MTKRTRIGLSYTYNENWIGGTYYIENLIHALNTLEDRDKPHLVLITNSQGDRKAAKSKINYPYLSFQLGSGETNSAFQFINKVSRRLYSKKVFPQKIKDLDAVFPYYQCTQQSLAKKKIYWIADFQAHFAPTFFDNDALKSRTEAELIIQASDEDLILSSVDAFQHFSSLYPHHAVKVYVLPFAVTHPGYGDLDIALLKNKYQLPHRYFICPNQFWQHKNQIQLIKAIAELKNAGIEITVAFTGNTKDYRNPDYFIGLKKYTEEHGLQDHVRFLGFIDRAEQLQLMSNALAIIQPSLFEGWSTVVEDAKAMNKLLIVSNINVHREQLAGSSALFFDPLRVEELAAVLKKVDSKKSILPLYKTNTYKNNIREFGINFLKLCS